MAQRSMVRLEGDADSSSAVGARFKVMTYNILADCYAITSWHRRCPEEALKWNYRCPRILHEIMSYDADIVCLQEVQKNHFRDYIEPTLGGIGYAGDFEHKRWSQDPERVEGCATFYRKDVFELERKFVIDYNEVTENKEFKEAFEKKFDRSSSFSFQCSRFRKGNIALVLKLRLKGGNDGLYVSNTHLYSDPRSSDVKLWQAKMLLEEIDMLNKDGFPLILCGDLNSTPESGVVELFKMGIVNRFHPDHHGNLADQHVLPGKFVSHSLHLKSAYSAFLSTGEDAVVIKRQQDLMDRVGQQPRFTNYGCGRDGLLFKGTLDYIFYSKSPRIRVTGLLELVSPTHVRRTWLPNYHFPSDHIALVAEFVIAP